MMRHWTFSLLDQESDNDTGWLSTASIQYYTRSISQWSDAGKEAKDED